jgi:nucleoside-specific outer membrane channel protein Tsx
MKGVKYGWLHGASHILHRLRSGTRHCFDTPRAAFFFLCLCASASASALEWTASEVQLLHSSRFREPGNPDRITKNIVTVEHANGYSLGQNFFFIDMLKSGNQELDLAGRREAPMEFYGEAYTTLSLSRLSGHAVSTGPVKDMGLKAGINLNRKDSQLDPHLEIYLAGLSLDFAVSRGFFNLSIYAFDDHTCFKGIPLCPDYRPTHQITPLWNMPFTLGPIDGEFAGIIKFIGSRGAGTVSQVFSQPQLRFDIGKPFGKKGSLYAGIEYQYWRNKYGMKDVDDKHPQVLLLWKF